MTRVRLVGLQAPGEVPNRQDMVCLTTCHLVALLLVQQCYDARAERACLIIKCQAVYPTYTLGVWLSVVHVQRCCMQVTGSSVAAALISELDTSHHLLQGSYRGAQAGCLSSAGPGTDAGTLDRGSARLAL
jgi:hypothetical protein